MLNVEWMQLYGGEFEINDNQIELCRLLLIILFVQIYNFFSFLK